jgi:hypothetical protein
MTKGRKQTREELERECRRISLDRDCFWAVLQDLLEGRLRATTAPEYYPEYSQSRGKGPLKGMFSATLYRVDSPTGGYIVVMHKQPGERERLHHVGYLEDWLASVTEWTKHASLGDEENMALVRLLYAVRREQRAELDRLAMAKAAEREA